MIKKIFCFLIVLNLFVFAQEEKTNNPTVELPDFVITGRDIVNVKKVNKLAPDFVTTISDEFLRPKFSAEELEIIDLSNPIKSDLGFLDSVNFFKGNIEAGVGLYTLPTLKGIYAQPFQNGIIEGNFSTMYSRPYVDHSDRYSIRGGGKLVLWSDINSTFLPGTQMNVSADYGTSSFKLFAAVDPNTKRTINSGNLAIGIRNNYGKHFQFGLSLTDQITSISTENFNDNFLRLKGESKILFSKFHIGVVADYHKHYVNNIFGEKLGGSLLLLRPVAGFQFTSLIKGSFGFTFSTAGDEKFNTPYASVGVKLDKNLTLYGEYAPTPEFKSAGTILRENDYFNAINYTSIYYEKSNDFSVAVKYEFDKYYQIDGGLRSFSSNNYPYFTNSMLDGKFELDFTKTNSFNPYVNLLYHLGPFGMFYSSINVFMVESDSSGKNIPYHPTVIANGTYSYRFDFGLESKVSLTYYSEQFADIENLIPLNQYFDLGLGFSYTFKPNLDFTLKLSNLLNNKIYRWNNYQEMPSNVIVGINYRL